jgi:hypothetical protein
MNVQNASDMMAASNRELMTLLDFAMMPNTGSSDDESAVDDFAVCLLRILHYIEGECERIARTRTTPTFYKIRVTTQLVNAVRRGTYPTSPSEPTVVNIHIPQVPHMNRRWSEGMKLLDNRLHILRATKHLRQL